MEKEKKKEEEEARPTDGPTEFEMTMGKRNKRPEDLEVKTKGECNG